MFKFKTIPPHEQKFNQDLIYPFLNKLRVSNPVLADDFLDVSRAIFILAEDNLDHISGGAVLLLKNQNTLNARLRRELNPFISSVQKVWTGTIRLELRPEISRQDFERCSEIFYKQLDKALVAFSRHKKTDFVCLSLTSNEQFATELLQKWSYVRTIRPKASGDGFFHNILCLTRIKPNCSPAFMDEFRKILWSHKREKDLV